MEELMPSRDAIPPCEVPPYVDTHVHFYDFDNPHGLWWIWSDQSHLPPDDGSPQSGGPGVALAREIVRSGTRRFTPPELWGAGLRLANLTKCVHVQATHGEDTVAETRWLSELNGLHGAPHAAIARVALEADDLDAMLERHLAFTIMRGVRDPGKTRMLLDPRYVRGVRRLGEFGLLFEVNCTHKRFEDLAALARQCPDTTIVLEHFGIAPRLADRGFAEWRERLTALAACENLRLKLSGIAITDAEWTYADARTLVHAGLEAFGVERCVVGSNWPVDRASGAYPDAVLATAAATAELSHDEQRALFAVNAEALYRI